MIPKVIHYCWFGKGLMPASQLECIKKWNTILPDYEIKRWDESNFDINICSYSKEAYQAKKYAYVSDVARCYVLNKYGGIYLDTDVELFKTLDNYLKYDFFSAVELYKEFYTEGIHLLDENNQPKDSTVFIPYFGLLSSVVGCCAQNPLMNDCLDYYMGLKVNADNFKGFAIDGLIANRAVKYGFVYEDKTQLLHPNILIAEAGIFGYADAINTAYSILYHHNAASWAPKSKKQLFLLKLDKLRLLKLYNKLKLIKKKIRGFSNLFTTFSF